MKKLLLLIVFAAGLISCGPEPINVTEVSLDTQNIDLIVGETFTLTVMVHPDNATDKTVTWSSSDPSVATVDNGVVKAFKIGATIISAKAGERSSVCSVRVVESGEMEPYNEFNTKASVDGSGKVSWSKGDVVRYYSKENGTVGECVVQENCDKAKLSMDVASDASFVIAVHGGTSVTSASENSFILNGAVKSEQSGKFEDAHVSVVKSSDAKAASLHFSNATSLVKFTLQRSDVAYIAFSSNDGSAIHGSGELIFSFTSETHSVSLGHNAGNSIKVEIGAAGTYYISMLPTTLSGGFTIDFYDSADNYIGMVKTDDSLDLPRNSIANLGVLDSRIVSPELQNLSEKGTANCYIVPSDGCYCFDATVKGSTSESISSPYKAYALWESFGTDVTPSVGDLIKDVKYKDGKVYFTSKGWNGNAVIALENNDGEIVWSWHIWCCMGYDPDSSAQAYNHDAGTMMDRNLGATSATPGDVHALGLLYQWGRKDPFLSGSSISYEGYSYQTKAASTIEWPESVNSDATYGSIKYSIEHPTTFIAKNYVNGDWHYTGDSSLDSTRWQTSDKSKGIYDPCPAGYRVPDGGSAGVWPTAFGSSQGWTNPSNWDDAHKGMDFGSADKPLGSGMIWYPAGGYLLPKSGSLFDVGNKGNYWSCTVVGNAPTIMFFQNNGSVYAPINGNFDCAYSVRCVKE